MLKKINIREITSKGDAEILPKFILLKFMMWSIDGSNLVLITPMEAVGGRAKEMLEVKKKKKKKHEKQ